MEYVYDYLKENQFASLFFDFDFAIINFLEFLSVIFLINISSIF